VAWERRPPPGPLLSLAGTRAFGVSSLVALSLCAIIVHSRMYYSLHETHGAWAQQPGTPAQGTQHTAQEGQGASNGASGGTRERPRERGPHSASSCRECGRAQSEHHLCVHKPPLPALPRELVTSLAPAPTNLCPTLVPLPCALPLCPTLVSYACPHPLCPSLVPFPPAELAKGGKSRGLSPGYSEWVPFRHCSLLGSH